MNVKKETIDEHFKNKKVNIGRERFIKKVKDSIYAEPWRFFCNISFVYKKKIECLTILMVPLFYMLSLGIFFIFCSLRKKLSMSTYGSADLRIEI